MERIKAFSRRLAVAVALLPFLAGCGRSGPPVYPVHGTVTHQGKALPTGSVLFAPDSGPAVGAAIGSDGGYHLMALAGKYRIAVTAVTIPPPGPPNENTHLPSLIPEKFGRIETSGLTAEVRAGQENTANLELR